MPSHSTFIASETTTCCMQQWMVNTSPALATSSAYRPSSTVLAIVDQSKFLVKDDFEQINIINVNVDRGVYSPTTADTQRAVESNLLDTKLLVGLCELRHPRIYCSALETAYPDPRPSTPEIIKVPAPTTGHVSFAQNNQILPK